MTCLDARALVSARLDGEPAPGLDEHLAGCDGCRHFAARGEEIRRALRFEPVGATPDLATAVRRRLEAAPPAEPAPAPARSPRSGWWAAAAALIVGVVVGAALVGIGEDGPRPVAAASLPGRVEAAQARIGGLHAELRLVERGWHPEVPERRFTGTLDYRAPESLALSWRDHTTYPGGAWRPNDVRLVTDGATWVASGLPRCPDLPDCTGAPEDTAVTGRPPFAEDRVVPLELVVPVRSFTSVDTATVVGEGVVAGRPTVEVRVAAAQVGPLLAGLRPAGNLRDVHPTDIVDLSLDAEQMVPLRLAVRASAEPERAQWAALRGYADEAGTPVLELEVLAIELDAPPRDRFDAPALDGPADAGFRPGPPPLALDVVAPEGFRPGRSGVLDGATPTAVWSWTDGRAWVRLQATAGWRGPGLFGMAEQRRLVRPTGTGAYVSADGHRVAVHGAGVDLVVDGTVATEELVELALAQGVAPADLPRSWPEQRSAGLDAIRAALPGALGLDVAGFDPPAGRLDGATALLFSAGAGDRSLLLEQRPGERIDQPVGLDYATVRLRGRDARYTPEAGRLEWVERGVVVVLEGTGLTRAELVEVAEGLR